MLAAMYHGTFCWLAPWQYIVNNILRPPRTGQQGNPGGYGYQCEDYVLHGFTPPPEEAAARALPQQPVAAG